LTDSVSRSVSQSVNKSIHHTISSSVSLPVVYLQSGSQQSMLITSWRSQPHFRT